MLSQAHFQASKRMTSFFQYALLILSAPMIILKVEIKNDLLIGGIFFSIGVVGTLIMLYLLQLRAETILYARSLNRIRNEVYTIKKQSTDLEHIERTQTLLTQGRKPCFCDRYQFMLAAIALIVISCIYVGYGIYRACYWVITYYSAKIYTLLPYFILHPRTASAIVGTICGLFYIGIAWLLYHGMSNHNENGSMYFQKKIGVGIDGVINQHETQFTNTYNQLFPVYPPICESDCDALPLYKSSHIRSEDGRRVYRTKEYWETMPIVKEVKKHLIDEIKDELGFDVVYFVRRNWKVARDLEDNYINHYNHKRNVHKWLLKHDLLKRLSLSIKVICEKGKAEKFVITRKRKYRTRISYAQSKRIMYFVEDKHV